MIKETIRESRFSWDPTEFFVFTQFCRLTSGKNAIFLFTEGTVGVGYLEFVTDQIVQGISESSGPGEIKILTVITEPFTNLIIQVSRVPFPAILDRRGLTLAIESPAGQKCSQRMGAGQPGVRERVPHQRELHLHWRRRKWLSGAL